MQSTYFSNRDIFNNGDRGTQISSQVIITHRGLVTSYGDIDLGQYWLR